MKPRSAGHLHVRHFEEIAVRILLLAILFPLFPANILAAEFILDGKNIVSVVTEKSITCNTFTVVIKSERFPKEYEMRVPTKFLIKGFNGADFIIGADAYFVTKDAKLKLPYASDVAGLRDHLRKATYIPTEAECTKEGFYVRYWSGGNGRGAEAGINYSVSSSGKVSAPLWFNESDFLKLYAK